MNVEQAYLNHYQPEIPPARSQVWAWFFMRLSGVALVFLALGHMAIMHLIGGGVDRVDFDFVAARWSGIGWRTYDWLLLVLALVHGGLGARTAIHDHIKNKGLRDVATFLLYLVVGFMMVAGTMIIATFDIARIPGV